MSGRSIIPPFSAPRRWRCRGSALLEAMHPSEETEESREGTAAHELAARFIDYLRRGIVIGFYSDWVGQTASNGVVWDRDAYEGALMYARDVQEVMKRTGNFTPHVEQRVSMPRIHPESRGTPDCWLYDERGRTLYIWDYKHGHGVVEVWDNKQLIEYLAGILDAEGIDGLMEQELAVVFTIVQPRAYHRDGPIRRWTDNVAELRGRINQLSAVEHECLGGDVTTTAGAEQCRDCSARYVCDTLAVAAGRALEYIGHAEQTLTDPRSVSVELQILAEAEGLIKARRTGLEAQAEAIIRRGESVPGWSLQAGQGRTEWSIPAAELFTIGDLIGVDLRKEPKPITPNQAKLAGVDESVISRYSEKKPGELKLVRTDDGLPARVFTNRSS